MRKRIFKADGHQALFDKQGFIVLPFITAEEIDYLNSLFDTLHPNLNKGGFFSGSYSNDIEYKKQASEAIVKTFNRAYESIFINYTPFGGAFLYKIPDIKSELAAHQDWTIVEEQKHVALNCWVPLCDVNKHNGALSILPGSHYDNFNTIRAPTLPFFYSNGGEPMIQEELIPIEVKAGTAIILNQSVIHYSSANKSNKIRKAITAGIKSKNAQMYFHYKIPNENILEVFEMDDDFLISFKNFETDIGMRPYMGKSLGTTPYILPMLKEEELYLKLQEMKSKAGYEMKKATNNAAIFQVFLKNTLTKWFS